MWLWHDLSGVRTAESGLEGPRSGEISDEYRRVGSYHLRHPLADSGQDLGTMVQEKLTQREMKGEGRIWSQAEMIILLMEGKWASRERRPARENLEKAPGEFVSLIANTVGGFVNKNIPPRGRGTFTEWAAASGYVRSR